MTRSTDEHDQTAPEALAILARDAGDLWTMTRDQMQQNAPGAEVWPLLLDHMDDQLTTMADVMTTLGAHVQGYSEQHYLFPHDESEQTTSDRLRELAAQLATLRAQLLQTSRAASVARNSARLLPSETEGASS